MRLTYTPRSLEDFDRILSRIGSDYPTAAVRLGEDLLRACEMLESHPWLGEAQPDLAHGLRRTSCRGYGVYYRVEADDNLVRVIRLLPPRMNVTPELFT